MTNTTSKAKSVTTKGTAGQGRAPMKGVARAELLDKATRARFEAELDAALKRKPTNEAKVAGAIRAVARLSPALRASVVDATQVMVKRGSYARELYAASIRALAESEDVRCPPLLRTALAADDAGGSATLSAACFTKDASLTAPLAKLAASRQSHLAFGAEVARVCRRESNGGLLSSLSPMIKESHRISLCVDLFVPLARSAPIPVVIGPALGVLRGAERHLGRWLVLADVAVKAGDLSPLEEAREKATSGPSSARAAWSLVTWALSGTAAGAGRIAAQPASPSTRPTVELVARLSDRPSADRDTTFLFRMARARAASCKPMLETLVKTAPLETEVSIRAASYLARDHGRADLREALLTAATNPKKDELRGLAVAALWDSVDANDTANGAQKARARDLADELIGSKVPSNLAWGALVRAAHTRPPEDGGVVVEETPLRWIEWGWLE